MDRNKENLLRTIVRMKKTRKRKPKSVKSPKLKVDDIYSVDYVDGTLKHISYLGKSEAVRDTLDKLLQNEKN